DGPGGSELGLARRRARAGPGGELPRGNRAHGRGSEAGGGNLGSLPPGGTCSGPAVSMGLALSATLLAAAPAPSALEALSEQLRAQVVAAHPEPPVAVAVEASSSALAETTAALVATRLGESGLPAVVIGSGEEAAARARSAGARSLVRLRLQVGAEVLGAGELRSVWRNFWAGRSAPETGPTRGV